jgi:hypothetical protein
MTSLIGVFSFLKMASSWFLNGFVKRRNPERQRRATFATITKDGDPLAVQFKG